MKNLFKKIGKNSGFTLTEVMIGMMILSIAIVTATNLLVNLVSTNRTNVTTLQAYYLAQEGLEAVRNIRDTNWLHNVPWVGNGELFDTLEVDKTYTVFSSDSGFSGAPLNDDVANRGALLSYSPWEFEVVGNTSNISVFEDGFKVPGIENTAADFYRHINILSVPDKPCSGTDQDCFILVQSVVNWQDGATEREFVLEAILSNWKDGVL